MSQTKVNRVMSKIRHELKPRRKLSNPDGPEGRLLRMRQTVTALIKHERIELPHIYGDESRGYAETLISQAIKYGEKHKETMELASFWLLEHQLVHKLFKVLVPRYQDCKFSYTKMWKAPQVYPNIQAEKCVLELRGNIYPELVPDFSSNHYLLHNLLLDEARKEFEKEQKVLESQMKKENVSKKVELLDWTEFDDVKEMAKLENWNMELGEEDYHKKPKRASDTTVNTTSSNDNNNKSNDEKPIQ